MSEQPSVDLSKTGYNLLEVADNLSVSAHLAALQHRITALHDYRIFGSTHEDDLIHLYSSNYTEDDTQIVRCGTFDHTMFESIDEYCGQKFPVEKIKQCILDGYKIEVHGIFPSHFPLLHSRLGYNAAEPIQFRHNKRQKKFNYVRPGFFDCINNQGEKVFIVAVNSGRDYVFHYASMLKHVVDKFSVQTANKIQVIRYPRAEDSMHIWTSLNSDLVGKNDTVIVGYAEEINKRFSREPELMVIRELDTEYYTSLQYKHKKTGRVFNLIGVKFSFWGCISAKIIAQICRLGAQEIVYIGKLGTLSAPEDIYNRIFVPSQFLIMYHDKIVCRIQGLRNNFLATFPELSTDFHVSVPTVVEEDYVQRKITADLKINSIDNEISQMAYAVAQFNREFGGNVSFTAMHFATDYIRRPTERNLHVKFDLSNNRTKEAFQRKVKILDDIANKLIDYINKG